MAAVPAKRACRRRYYPGDPTKEVVKAAIEGDVVLLNEVLQELSSSDRASILKATISSETGFTILHHVAWRAQDYRYASSNVLKCLIENGADVNVRSADSKCTPLMTASEVNDLTVIKILLEHGADVHLKDKNGLTSLHYAVIDVPDGLIACDVLKCLLENGADINALTNYNSTPLMLASRSCDVNVIKFFLNHGSKNDGRALHFACDRAARLDILLCLIGNGADVNARGNDNCTPLMTASRSGQVNKINVLINHGANLHLQDDNGDTAMHYAVCSGSSGSNSLTTLIAAGASQLMCNKQGLTPLLLASCNGATSLVEQLIKGSDITKEHRITALELLGASLITCPSFCTNNEGLQYLMLGMEERYADPLHPVLKQPMEPIDAYQYRKESQSLEELVKIEKDVNALRMESLIIRERILGKNSLELLDGIRSSAWYYRNIDVCTCVGLYRHAMKTAQRCTWKYAFANRDIERVEHYLLTYEKSWSNEQKQTYVVELLEAIAHEWKKTHELMGNKEKRIITVDYPDNLFIVSLKVITFLCKCQYFELGKSSAVSVLLRRLSGLNPQDRHGSSLLHETLKCCLDVTSSLLVSIDVVKILLNTGFNVNATDFDGNTPLHLAVCLEPQINEIHIFTNLLEILLDGGAHQDFVNHDGETAMDLAKTDEARSILWDKRKLKLKCISARAVKRFGLPYLGVVPKILEKFISMH